MTTRSFDLDDGIRILERTPRVLRALLADLPTDLVRADDGPDTWSPFDVVGHLIDGEETDWMVRARIILEHGPDTPFEPFDRFRHLESTRGRGPAELLDRFADLRAENLRALRSLELTDADLSRTGRHPDLGEVTLRQLLATWVAHDLAHTAQVARTLARQLRDDVGPWRAYLSALD